ncbi:DNA-directed RNA polymerase subunit omega [Gracilibacillus halophilus YIM-C55.5]|uniref:DNA-directed RNA polymerase subunit omega n=1 Tax=Gracilibacillus halophilus YIM-C55.5 TaxID=1308866 RepID=N4WV87_9BACI|nr:DNA-directed RNA polymerase subunit omega [Gracilibacillus halophilus]ENH98290.1 DNA-directed RNA polymerase subunit omega [Gracilibacillus halophilus YIM-C55.5]
MILEPSVDRLQTKINSKYTLVTLAAKRARQIQLTKRHQLENPQSATYVGLALEEIMDDKLKVKNDE